MTLGATDLVRAAADAYTFRHWLPHPDVGDTPDGNYYVRWYQVLRAALGVSFDVLGEPEPDLSTSAFLLREVLRSTVIATATIHSPLGGILEAPRDIIELCRTHGPLVEAAVDRLRNELEALAVSALEKCSAGVRDRTTSEEALIAAGLPVRPWEDDEP